MLYENISNGQIGLNKACTALGVSKAGYFFWSKKEPVQPDALLASIQKVALKNPRYGYRRITHELHRQKMNANHKKILRIMRQNGLLVKRKASFKPKTTNSNHDLPIYPNLIEGLVLTRLNQVWVSDITYIGLLDEFVYLAVVMDKYSRKILGWQLSRDIDSQLCIDALEKAFESRKGQSLSGLIHHSDQGMQYACSEYTKRLTERDILISMSRKGNPYDNANAESLIKTIKYEEIYLTEYESFQDAYENIETFIEKVYNKKRLHSAIGYQPPAEFEQKIIKEVSA